MLQFLNLIAAGLLLLGCASIPSEFPNPDVIYRKDMILSVNGIDYEGVAVIPQKENYKIHITAQGDLDLFTFDTCHREEISVEAWNKVDKKFLFFKRKIENKREIDLTYIPTEIEKGYCPANFGGYEKLQGRHSWGFLDFQGPEETLPAKIYCNGSEIVSSGVSACQSKEGLIQAIKFSEPVKVYPTKGCEISSSNLDYWEFPIHKGHCVYAFKGSSGRIHRATFLGYEKVLIRGAE